MDVQTAPSRTPLSPRPHRIRRWAVPTLLAGADLRLTDDARLDEVRGRRCCTRSSSGSGQVLSTINWREADCGDSPTRILDACSCLVRVLWILPTSPSASPPFTRVFASYRLPDCQRGNGRTAADRRRHRSRIAAARSLRRPVGWRRIRAMGAAFRRRRFQSPRGRVRTGAQSRRRRGTARAASIGSMLGRCRRISWPNTSNV